MPEATANRAILPSRVDFVKFQLVVGFASRKTACMSGRLSAGQMQNHARRLSNPKKPGVGSGRAIFTSTFRNRFANDASSDDGGSTPLITKLDKYTPEELKEYRQVFNMFDTDRSGAIGLDELENAITNLGMDPKQVDLELLIREADRRGNHQIDFDEFCMTMKSMSEKHKSWQDVTRQCFDVFDRTECGMISQKDFEYVLREIGDINNSWLLEELFTEYDVDGDGFIGPAEFGVLVRDYLTDDDIT
ncbi:calmodulin isoform a [Aphelenchoides avenae]|nr:calmodulin isoform a [Aphelenchus avenae]